MSLSNYVRVTYRHDDPDPPRPGPVVLYSPRWCQHVETVCASCFHQWLWDHLMGVTVCAERRLRRDGIAEGLLKAAGVTLYSQHPTRGNDRHNKGDQ
jgi:hypothetical protein